MQCKQEIKNFIIENFLYGQMENAPGDDTSFLENGVIDSTGVLELVSFIQEKYEIHVFDDELIPDNFDSLNKLEAFISQKCSDKNIDGATTQKGAYF
jgi:acyl carrier protein